MTAERFRGPVGCCIVVLIVAACSSSSPRSLRLVTFNTQLLAPLARCGPDLPGWEEAVHMPVLALTDFLSAVTWEFTECIAHAGSISPTAAAEIAKELIALDLDVIALNEVFDNDAKDVLVSKLKGKYPHYLRDFGQGSALEDSGLMLFSRLPFEPLPNQPAALPPSKYFAAPDGTTTSTAKVLFDACDGFDCHADKGAAVVRLRYGPDKQDVYTIVFTHAQADGGKHQIRQRQLTDIIEMLHSVLLDPHEHRILIVGDLNIRGQDGSWDADNQSLLRPPSLPSDELSTLWFDTLEGEVPPTVVATGTPVGHPTLGNGFQGASEWEEFARRMADWDHNGDVYADGWASFMSDEDPGITILGKSRYDYVLANRTSYRELDCLQHMTTRDLGRSDHRALTVDVNLLADYCNPRQALADPPLEQRIGGTIRYPRSMQWYRISLDQESTMSIGVEPAYSPLSAAGVAFEVFRSSDLSNPVVSHLGEKQFVVDLDMWATKYQLFGDFYVRVFSPNPDWHGSYEIGFHRHQCKTVEDACLLYANSPQHHPKLFEINAPLGANLEAWFQIDVTDVPDSGAAQPLVVYAQHAYPLTPEVFSKKNPSLQPDLANLGWAIHGNRKVLATAETGKPSFYLRLSRPNLSWGTPELSVGWETPLTRLHGENLGVPGAGPFIVECNDETNGFAGNEAGDDEIHFRINPDGTGWKQVLGKDYDCNSGGVRHTVGAVARFIKYVDLQLIEGDGDGNDDDSSSVHRVSILGPGYDYAKLWPDYQGDAGGEPRVVNTSKAFSWAGGTYTVYYSLSPPQPEP